MPEAEIEMPCESGLLESESVTICSGENHYLWKGDAVQNGQLHAWIRKELFKVYPKKCYWCESTKRVEAANITGVYNRDISNFLPLCKKCHNDFDGLLSNLKQGPDAILDSPRRNPNTTEKLCSKCGVVKPLSEFYPERGGYRFDCKVCNVKASKRRRIEKYGIGSITRLEIELAQGIRSCTKCKKIKPLSEFNISSGRKSKTTSHCKDCSNAHTRSKYIKASPENSRVMQQRIDIANGVRVCITCGVKKQLSEFSKNDSSTRASCKVCYNEKNRLKRLAREKVY